MADGKWHLPSAICHLPFQNQHPDLSGSKEFAMKYSRFEELLVWQAAIEFAVKVFEFTSKPQFKGFYSLKDQLERAAVSISNNIAEGFERGTTNELLAFIYIARGSAGECRSMLHLFAYMPAFAELKAETATLRSRAESVARQLGKWAESLQDTNSKRAVRGRDAAERAETKRD